MNTSRIVFFGTPPFAVASLKAILSSGRSVPLVVTQPDRPAGRGRKLSPPAVKEYCVEKQIPFLQPAKMRATDFHNQLREAGSSLFVVAAYGRILPTAILSIPESTLNVHASLLPKWRGAAPIERAILAGDTVTGISIMRLVEEMDAGDVLLQNETPIHPMESAGELSERLANLGGSALLEALDRLDRGAGKFEPQDVSRVTFAPPIKVEEAKISWARPAIEVHRQVCAMNPRPGAFTHDGKWRMKIWKTVVTSEAVGQDMPGRLRVDFGKLWVASSDKWIEIVELQREGKSVQPASVFLTGYPIRADLKWE